MDSDCSVGHSYVLWFVFLFSLAVEPLYPQVCHKVAVFKETLPGEGPSPVDLSRSLNSVACSINFRREDPISIFHLIMEVSYLCFTKHGSLFIGSFVTTFNPLNSELNPICLLLALLGAHPILHVSRIRVKFVKLLAMRLSVKSKLSIANRHTVVAVNEAIQQVSTQTMQAVL